VEEDQLVVTLRMLAEGQQVLTDILSQLDKLPAERSVKINVTSDDAAGGITDAADSVTSSVDTMNKSMATMPAVAEETSTRVGTSMNSMGGFMSETKGNLNSLTGGMMGFLPIMAGFSLVSATGQFDAMAKSVQAFKVESGTTAKVASDWVGVAGIYGLNANTLGMAIKGLQTKQESLETTFAKTGSNVASSTTAVSRAIAEYGKNSIEATTAEAATVESRNKVTIANDAYSIATQKITTDNEKLSKAIATYGANSTQAQTAEQALETAQSHRLATSDSVLSAQTAYTKATGSTTAALTTTQAAEQRLGINLLNNKGQMVSSTTILTDMADAYTKTGGSAQTVADITTILGGRAKAILPLFAEGSQGITDAINQTKAAGGEMTQQQLTVGVAAGKTMADIKANIKNMFVGLGADLLPVFDFVDAHVKGIMDIAKAVLAIFLTVKIIKFATGFISDIGKLVNGFKSAMGMASTVKNAVSDLTSSGGGAGSPAAQLVGARVTVMAFGPDAYGQLRSAGMGGGLASGASGLAKTVESDEGDAGFLGMLGKIPGIGGLFGGAAAGTAEAGGLSIGGMAGGIGVGATAGVFAAALAPIAAMFLSAQGQGEKNGQFKADTGLTSGIFSIPGLTSATSKGDNAFSTFLDAVGTTTSYTTVMGRKVKSVSDNMNDVQGKADMGQFFNDVSKMPGFSGMTVTQEQQLMKAVQSGAINTQSDMTLWLANNGIIAQTSKTSAANAESFSQQMITLAQTATQNGPALDSNLVNLEGYLKTTAGASNNLSGEASTLAFEFKGHAITTQAQLAAFESDWTAISTATKGSKGATTLFTNLLNSGVINLNTPVSQIITFYQQMAANGLKATTASYKYMLLLQAAANQAPPPALAGASSAGTKSLPHGGPPKLAGGGVISEEIYGIGLRSGGTYSIGENGPEAIIPLGKTGGSAGALPIPSSGGGGGGGGSGVQVNISFPNSLTFLNNANQIDELSKAIETRLATVRLPHRGVRMSPH
jgi:hypothetical protein